MTDKTDVLEINAAFYCAMREGDYFRMQEIWSDRQDISCTHPSGPPIFGRREVMESWWQIFAFSGAVSVEEDECEAVITGNTALVLCREKVGRSSMMASNAFQRESGVWRMINHQATQMPDA
ncbi:MAG: nuclear transport factor 2 family protein [Pseudomonadota bacterium]